MIVNVDAVPAPPTGGPLTVACSPGADTDSAFPEDPPDRLTGVMLAAIGTPATRTSPSPDTTLAGTGTGASDGGLDAGVDDPPEPGVDDPPPPEGGAGGDGGAGGVTAFDAADAADGPTAFVAVEVNV